MTSGPAPGGRAQPVSALLPLVDVAEEPLTSWRAFLRAHARVMRVLEAELQSEQQLARLRELGCPQVQGFLLSQPLPPHAILALVLDSQ